jgi:hypothetical protein
MWNVVCEVEMGGRAGPGGVWRSFAVDMVTTVAGLGYDRNLYVDKS